MPLEKLPEGYAGTKEKSDPPADVARQQFEPDPSVIDMIVNAPSAVSQAITGEGAPIEFAFLPELTDMGADAPGFFEGLSTKLKVMLARDDYGKAEIIHNAFDGDPRYGGKYRDEFGLPIIVWNNIPYYINKPGLTFMDLNTMVGEIVKFAPASKFTGAAKTALETAARGTAAYSATELAAIAGEAYITPEATALKKRTADDIGEQVATSTAIGVGADMLSPPVAKLLGKGIRAGTQAIGRGSAFDEAFPRFSFDVISDFYYSFYF